MNRMNKELRAYAIQHNVKLWEIAAGLNMTDSTFSRKLRFKLSPDMEKKARDIIDSISKHREAAGQGVAPAQLGNMQKEIKKEENIMSEDRELKEARDECVRLGLLQKQGKNLNGADTYVKTEKGERIFKELLEDARNGIVYD